MSSQRALIDWDGVEREYRAGIRSLRDIAAEYGCSNPAILKRAKRDGWIRDLSERIRAKAAALVSTDAVSDPVSAALTERSIVEANAEMQAGIIRAHRADITALREKANAYRVELDNCGDDLAKRAGILKILMDVQKSAIGLERQAFGIADTAEGDKPAAQPAAILTDDQLAAIIHGSQR